MALTSQQLISLALQTVNVPKFTLQAGQLLNMILSDLCQNYSLAAALGSGTVVTSGAVGSGPYNLPADYLRMAGNEVRYSINQVPYVMVNIDLAEFDALIQQIGDVNFPELFATDPSQVPPVIFLWPPPNGALTINIRYYRQMPDIASPESSTAVPWFPNSDYLLTRLTGELMRMTGNERSIVYLEGAKSTLREYLILQADDEGRAKTVKLDRRRFGSKFSRLPKTKLYDF